LVQKHLPALWSRPLACELAWISHHTDPTCAQVPDRTRDRGLSGSLCREQYVFLAPSRNSTKGQTNGDFRNLLLPRCGVRVSASASGRQAAERIGVHLRLSAAGRFLTPPGPTPQTDAYGTKLGNWQRPQGPPGDSFSLRPPRISAPLRFNLTSARLISPLGQGCSPGAEHINAEAQRSAEVAEGQIRELPSIRKPINPRFLAFLISAVFLSEAHISKSAGLLRLLGQLG
jgi:hypothetical protein